MNKPDDLHFKSFRELAYWLLESKGGQRFQRSFLLMHWRRLLSSALGAKFVEFVSQKVLYNDRHNFVPIVVEISPDGGVRVFGYGANVKIVNLLKVQTPEAEAMAEEYVEVTLKGKHREVYSDARKCLALGTTRCISVDDLAYATSVSKVFEAGDQILDRRDRQAGV